MGLVGGGVVGADFGDVVLEAGLTAASALLRGVPVWNACAELADITLRTESGGMGTGTPF